MKQNESAHENSVQNSQSDAPLTPEYWRSLDELAQSEAFQQQLKAEFPAGASEPNGLDRRSFLQLMGASLAYGGLAGGALLEGGGQDATHEDLIDVGGTDAATLNRRSNGSGCQFRCRYLRQAPQQPSHGSAGTVDNDNRIFAHGGGSVGV